MHSVSLISRKALLENQQLTQRLEALNHKTNIKNVQLYNLETRLENLYIFEQHMTSLNLRCEFLEKQISNLKFQNSTDNHLGPNTSFTRSNEFNSRMEWRTTETTLDNLCTEFKYLKDQLDQANEQISMDASFNDSVSDQSKSTVLFSENDSCSMEEDHEPAPIIVLKEKQKDIVPSTPAGNCLNQSRKKKLLKMESFLNFKEPVDTQNMIKPDTELKLKGFKISSNSDTPFYEANPTPLVRNKLSNKSLKKKLELVDLPCIDEEYLSEESFVMSGKYDSPETTPLVQTQRRHVQFPKNAKYHHRHSSLPDNSSLEENLIALTPKDSLKHFISDDVNLHSRFQDKSCNITDLLFSNEPHSQQFSSSSPFSSFKDSYIDDLESDIPQYAEYNLSDPNLNLDELDLDSRSDSDESYGSENATPLILRKKSKVSILRTKSAESIATVVSRSTKHFPLREKNLDLKAQTMRWLTPNTPVVSFTTSSEPIQASVSSSVTQSAHDNIISFLHSGVKDNTESTPIKQSNPISISISNTSNNTWVPSKIFASPIPVPMAKPIEEVKSSWISSFIPNSAFTNSEIGKPIPQTPTRSNSPLDKNFKFPKHDYSSSFNGPSSSLTIQKNGNRIVRHGYGSSFNDSVVVSSRVSHGALREALKHDMV